MSTVALSSLQLGELLAEGGEGRVYDVAAGPGPAEGRLVYKQLRRPRPLAALSCLISFPSQLGAGGAAGAGLAARVRASSAWPRAAVVGDDPSLALGVLLPRAPAEFWLHHRDGAIHLATLSYLAGDPDRIAVAYGASMPAPGAAARVAVVYALCRLLSAWQGGPGPQVVHGDLSAKNVLWSLSPVPAVYVLDCDGAVVAPGPVGASADVASGPGGASGDGGTRVTTPNWEDPAAAGGDEPAARSDRYALGLAFLRVVGAAHFPVQGSQRAGDHVDVDLELPRSWRRLPDMPALWRLCERSLSLLGHDRRPAPQEWAEALEAVLEVLGEGGLAAAVRHAQGDPGPQLAPGVPPAKTLSVPRSAAVPDVAVRPVLRRRTTSTWQLVSARPPLGSPVEAAAGRPVAALSAAGPGLTGLGLSTGLTWRQVARRVVTVWGGAHRLAIRLLRSPGRRAHGLRRLGGVLALDVAATCVVLFLVGMVVSPWVGL